MDPITLTDEQKTAIVDAMRQAVRYQCLRWDAERLVEKAVGLELETEDAIKNLAAIIDDAEQALEMSPEMILTELTRRNSCISCKKPK